MKKIFLILVIIILFGCSNNTTNNIEEIGKWEEVDDMMSGTYTIYKENGELKMNMLFMDNSEMIIDLKESKENGKTRYDYKDNSKNDYFIIENSGNLGLYDLDGKISEAVKEE